MHTELEPQQKLLLWLLAVQPEGGMFLSEIGLTFKPAGKRRILATHGYTEESSRKSPKTGRKTTFISLTDKGWEWCQDHMTEAITSKSPRVKDVLSGLLTVLSRYFQNQSHCSSLGELVLQARQQVVLSSTDTELANADLADMPAASLQDAIREACLSLTSGQKNVRVRLTDLRRNLSSFPRDAIDRELLAMERAGDLTAFRLDNPDEITEADEAAVLTTPAGSDRHIVYFQGSHS